MVGKIEVEKICNIYTPFIGRSRIYPLPGRALFENGVLATLVLAANPNEIVDLAFKLCRDPAVQEFFFSLDCHNQPWRQAEYHSVLIVFHVGKGSVPIARLGVMEYGWDERQNAATIVPLRWDDPFWAAKYGDLLLRLERQCGRRSGMIRWQKPWERRPVVLN